MSDVETPQAGEASPTGAPQSVPGGKGWNIRPAKDLSRVRMYSGPSEVPPPGVPAGGAAPAPLTWRRPGEESPAPPPVVASAPQYAPGVAPGPGWLPVGGPASSMAAPWSAAAPAAAADRPIGLPPHYGPPAHTPPLPDYQPWKPAPRQRSRGVALFTSWLGMRLTIFVVTAAVGAVVLGRHNWLTSLFHSGHSLSQPASINGTARLDDPTSLARTNGAVADLKSTKGVDDAIGGVYGSGRVQYILLAARGNNSDVSSNEVLNSLSDLVSVNRASAEHRTIDGVDYTCSAVSGALDGVACIWQDYDVDGMLLDVGETNVDVALNAAKSARDSTDR